MEHSAVADGVDVRDLSGIDDHYMNGVSGGRETWEGGWENGTQRGVTEYGGGVVGHVNIQSFDSRARSAAEKVSAVLFPAGSGPAGAGGGEVNGVGASRSDGGGEFGERLVGRQGVGRDGGGG